MLRACVSVCLFAVLAGVGSTSANAQTFDQRTYFTFSQPVALPGVTLPAGKYLFRLVDPVGGRRVVQILDSEGKKSYATLLTIPSQRFDVPESPEVRFMETAASTPSALKTWWYPGSTLGYEFIYPKEQALRLARNASAPVLTTSSAEHQTTEAMKSADLTRVDAAGVETAVSEESSPAATTIAGPAQTGALASASLPIDDAPAPAGPTPAAATSAPAAVAPVSTRSELPQTGSFLPLICTLGAISLLAGVALVSGPRVGS